MKNPDSQKPSVKRTILLGILCLLFTAASSWYAITYNDSRLVAPTDFSEFTFRIQDLPMILSLILCLCYFLYLFILLIRAILSNKRRERTSSFTRCLNPRLGCLGFLGFGGFLGFWTYQADGEIFPFVYFLFFSFFGFFYEGKMSNTLIDERFRENALKARTTANRIATTIIFLACLVVGSRKLMGNLEYTLIAFLIVVVLSLALNLFLEQYLLYHYDHDDQSET